MARYTHGLSKTRLYSILRNMKQRCYNPNNPRYNVYGAIGIKVCDEWLNDFKSFYDWAMSNGYRDDLTLNGETKRLYEWAELYNIKVRTLISRLDKGMKLQEALTKPIKVGGKNENNN